MAFHLVSVCLSRYAFACLMLNTLLHLWRHPKEKKKSFNVNIEAYKLEFANEKGNERTTDGKNRQPGAKEKLK